MSTITINDEWQIKYDGVCYMPEKYVPSHIVEKGKHAGNVKEAKWEVCGKYFPSVDSSLRYIIEQDVLNKGDMSLDEFLVEYKASTDELTELIQKALGE